ncbi:MAG TPA: hypothetical protein VK745_24195 [Polyangiaceae bacterium]|jgi:hypothetical protein|nr:hypothetical protein [Polyangiaceae bacterium]
MPTGLTRGADPDPIYAQAKLREVVRTLATGPGNAVDRVLAARRILWRLNSQDFPGELGRAFTAITADIDGRKKPGGGYQMTPKTGAKFAGRMLDLWYELAEANRRNLAARSERLLSNQ